MTLRGLWARTRRALLWSAGLTAILFALVLLVLETRAGRDALLRAALDAVEARTGLVVRAEGMDLALRRREVRVHGLTLGVPGKEPFLRAAEIRLAWSPVPFGQDLVPDSVEVEGVRIALRRGSDGRFNLPSGSGSGAGSGAPTYPRRLSVRSVAVSLSDTAQDLEVKAGGVSLRAEGSRAEIAGSLSLEEPLQWRAREKSGEVAFTPAVFRLSRSLTLEPWTASASEGQLRLEGTWADVFGAGGLGLAFVADVDLDRLAARAAAPPVLAGGLRLEGRITGTAAEPRADFNWRGIETRVAGRRVGLEGHAAITARSLDFDHARVELAGGRAEGAGHVGFAAADGSRVEGRGSAFDLGALLAPSGKPRPIDALVGGHLGATWPGLEWRRAGAEVILEATAGRGAGAPLEGSARLTLQGGKWTLATDLHSREDARLSGQLEGRLGSGDLGEASIEGFLALEAHTLTPLASALGAKSVVGEASGRVVVAGTFASPRASLDLRGQGVRVDQGPPVGLSVQGALDHQSLTVLAFDLHAGSAHVQATGRFLRANRGLEGRYEIDVPDLAALASVFPRGAEPAGSLHGKGTLGGTSIAPRLNLSAEGSDLRLAGQAVEAGRFELGLEGSRIRVDSIELEQPQGRLRATAVYDRRTERFSLSLRGRAFEIGPLPAGLAGPDAISVKGRVGVEFEGSGTLAAPGGRGRLTLEDGQWKGRNLGPMTADLTLDELGLGVDLAAADLRGQARATIRLDSPHAFSGEGRLDETDLTTAARLLGLDPALASGTISLEAKATGSIDDPGQSRVSLAVSGLRGSLRGRPLRLAARAELDADASHLGVRGLDLSVGQSHLRLEGALDARGDRALEGSFSGRLGEIVEIASGPAASEADAPMLDGTADTTFRLSGPWERPRVSAQGRIEDGTFRFAKAARGQREHPAIDQLSGGFSVDEGVLRLEALRGTWSGVTVAASGELTGSLLEDFLPARFLAANAGPAPRGSLHARLEGDGGGLLSSFLNDRLRSSGGHTVLTADLETSDLRAEAVQGEVKLEGGDVMTSDVALRQTSPAILRLRDGMLTLEGAAWSGPSTKLRLSAKGAVGPKDDPLGGATLDAELTGDGDLRLLQALGRGVESGGAGSFRVRVRGPLSRLLTEGEIRLSGATLRHRPTRFALDGLTGTLRWGGAGLEVEGLTGSLNGGPLEASGTLRRRESGSGFLGAIRLQARSAFIEWPPGLRAGLRANLVLEPADEGLRLSGALRVQDGTYRTREYFSLQVLDLVNRFATGTSPSPLDPLRLDLTLKSREDVQLDAVDGRIAVGVDLQIRGSVGAPEIGGRLTAGAGGQLFMSGRTYDLESAVLDFTRGAGFEPYVQARAVTRVSEYTVMADVAGPATRAQTRFASTPPLGEQDIVALLTSGRTVGAGGTGSQTDALSMASGGVLGKTGQRLGLDSLKIDSTAEGESLDFDPTAINSEADPSSRLTFSKRLTANLSATFSRSLTKTASYTWFVAWKARPSLELRVAQRDDQSVAFEFRHEIVIGGSKAATATTRPRRRRRLSGERVTAVAISGDPVKITPSELELREGQPFDYETWLDDRDRLEAELGREGYLEGRVLARRESPEAETVAPPAGGPRPPRTVALVYDIRRGPGTRLVIEGVPAPAGLRTKIERAWRLGDFDSSIEDEAVVLTRAHLYERLYMRAHVTARAETSREGDTKSLTIRAEAGIPVRSKRIVFHGHAKVPDSRLQALVREPSRAEAAWLRPEDLRAAVVTLYESEGLLAAQVEVEEPTFVGDVAELEVRIDEGPVVPIRGVSASGTEHLTPEAVLSAAALSEGQPFKPVEVEAARARVESAYRRLGYNDATVRTHGGLDPATGTMKVEFQVKEGVREVLAEIEAEGGSPGAQGKAQRRLGLEPGEPVVLDEWTEARRRLYETGLYRKVDLEPIPMTSTTEGGEGDRPIKARLTLDPWPALRLRYGLQLLSGSSLASEEGRKDLQVGAVAEVSRQTLFGRAAAIGLSVQVRKEEQEARAYLSVPRSFGTPVRSSLFLTVTPEHNTDEVLGGEVDIRKTELTWEERIRATRRLDFAAAYKLQWNRFEFGQTVEGLPRGDRLDISLARVVGTALFDARNNLIDTTRGWFSSASMEWGGDAVGSDYPLTRAFVQQFVYLPIPANTVFGAAARVERAKGQGSAFLDTDRLQAGGANTVRGFDDDALTSRSIVNFLGGSTTLLVLNAELRFPIHGPVRGVLFGDGAISRAKFSDESSRESIWSTGLGLRYVTPVGILRLDYGIPLDGGWQPKRGRVYFSLGQVF